MSGGASDEQSRGHVKRIIGVAVAVIGLIASVIGILVFITGRNLPELVHKPDTAVASSSASASVDHNSALTVVATVIPGEGLQQVGSNAFELTGPVNGYPQDFRGIQVHYEVLLDGAPVTGLCSVVINLRNWYDGDHKARSASCADTIPGSESSVSFNVWPEVNDPIITIDAEFGPLSATTTADLTVTYAGE